MRIFAETLQEQLFDEGLRIGKVKKECGLCDNNISSRFGYYMGRTPKKYVVHHRMRLAKMLLHESAASLTEIAFEIGYDNLSAFNMAFSNYYDCRPTAYRENCR